MTYDDFRNSIQNAIYLLIDPPIRWAVRAGVTPNMVTAAGALGNVAAGVLFALAGEYDSTCLLIGLGGALMLLFSTLDMVDGRMARMHTLSSPFGAFWDSVLDRYCEIATLGGLVCLFFETGHTLWALTTILSLGGSLMVSYVRARAEAQGFDCKVGLMQRPERVVLTAAGALLCGILSPVVTFDPLLIAAAPQFIIALLANFTALHRIWHVWRQTV